MTSSTPTIWSIWAPLYVVGLWSAFQTLQLFSEQRWSCHPTDACVVILHYHLEPYDTKVFTRLLFLLLHLLQDVLQGLGLAIVELCSYISFMLVTYVIHVPFIEHFHIKFPGIYLDFVPNIYLDFICKPIVLPYNLWFHKSYCTSFWNLNIVFEC